MYSRLSARHEALDNSIFIDSSVIDAGSLCRKNGWYPLCHYRCKIEDEISAVGAWDWHVVIPSTRQWTEMSIGWVKSWSWSNNVLRLLGKEENSFRLLGVTHSRMIQIWVFLNATLMEECHYGGVWLTMFMYIVRNLDDCAETCSTESDVPLRLMQHANQGQWLGSLCCIKVWPIHSSGHQMAF